MANWIVFGKCQTDIQQRLHNFVQAIELFVAYTQEQTLKWHWLPGVDLKTSVCKGRVVVALRGDLDVTDADAGTGTG